MTDSRSKSRGTLHGIALPGQSVPAASFAEPFEMLAACHERVERMLALLARLIDYLRTHEADPQSRQAARDVMRYFDLAAPLHHQDEELHVFPALLAGGDARLQALAQRLAAEHRRMEVLWRAVRAILQNVADAASPTPALPASLPMSLPETEERVLRDFIALYEQHLEAENEDAYPFAQAALDAGAIATMSADMQTRRGVKGG